jgi:probable HAF family extracellular repeat protein
MTGRLSSRHFFTRARTWLVVLSLAMSAPGVRAADKALFIALPPGALPLGVNANGTVVVGVLRTGGGFYWMPTTGVVYVGGTQASAVSRDGQTIVGAVPDARKVEQAGIWIRATEWRMLGSIVPNASPCDNLLSSSFDTSDDGKVIVGLAWNGCSIARAFRWEEATGMVDLGSTVPGRSSRADGVSGDGKVVVGWQEASVGFRQGARWTGGKQELFTGPEGPVGEANAANSDGSVVVGQFCRPLSSDQSAWVWTARDGLKCAPVPRLRPGGFSGLMLATSDDGRVIGGSQSFGLESEAVIWFDRTPSYLKDYLRANGVPDAFTGWVNTGFITGVSPDGRVLVGYGAGATDFQGYIVVRDAGGSNP